MDTSYIPGTIVIKRFFGKKLFFFLSFFNTIFLIFLTNPSYLSLPFSYFPHLSPTSFPHPLLREGKVSHGESTKSGTPF